jgi:CubicO group peptidase (beta-lactamase class C family)
MRFAQRQLLGSASALLLLFLPNPAQAQHFPSDEDVELVLRYLVEDGKAEGIVVGFLEANDSTRVVSYGTPGPGARPLGPRSVFEAGSIGKTFTATLLSHMVLSGEVALDDPVLDYLPEGVTAPALGGREITLLDLATHRSGLPKNPGNHQPADPDNPYAEYTVETIYDFLSSHELRRQPGAEFEYSNLGFQVLGQGLARAAGMSYDELHRERILVPLGMTGAGFTLSGELAQWAVRGYRNGSPVPHWEGTDARRGAGGMYANVEDMLKYLKANVGPPETELEEAMRAAHEPRFNWGNTQDSIGLAWTVRTVQGRRILQHGGNTGGFSALIAFDPGREVGIVWLTNTYAFSDPTPTELLLFGKRTPQEEAEIAHEVLASYAGRYQAPSGTSLHVRREAEGHLTLQRPRRARARLFAESDSSFALTLGPTRLIFEKSEAGDVRAVRKEGNALPETFRRVSDESPPPRAVVAGTGWHELAFQWKPVVWVLLGALMILILLTLGAEIRRRSRRGIGTQP